MESMGRVQRRQFLIGAIVSASPLRLLAQHVRVPRIGYLLFVPLADPPSRERQAFLDGMRELGHVPGKTVEIVYGSAEGEPDFISDACQDLLRQKVELIVASGPIAVLAAKKATGTVPIVMQAVGDPIGIGVVRSLGRPEANVTGVSFNSSDLAGKRVELIRDLVPAARRIAVLWDARNANARAEARVALDAALGLGLKPEEVALPSDSDLLRALGRLQANKPDALYVTFEEGIVVNNRSVIAEFGVRHQLPMISGWSSLTEAGGLISYAPDIAAIFRRSAYYVNRILKGTKPSELPVELARSVELVINLRTAKALDLKIPQSILLRADRVIV
jgi:putative ABC transport system substrate-binding protein